MFWGLVCTVHLTICCCHVTYALYSESTLYIFLNVKGLFPRNKCDIWILSDCNWNLTHNYLVRKRTRNHLAKMSKWLRRVVSTCLYGALDSMFLSCQVPISQLIYTLYLPECQGSLCSKQVQYLTFKWLQLHSILKPLSSETNTETIAQTVPVIELCCGYLSLRCIWLDVFAMSHTHFRVNPSSIFAWMSRNSLLQTRAISEV